MPAISEIIKNHELEPISLISLLFLTKGKNELFAGVFIKSDQEYFVIQNSDGIIYFDFHEHDLTRVLQNKISLWKFITNRRDRLQFNPKNRWKLRLLFLIWLKIKTNSYCPMPNAYYVWHEYLQSKLR